MVEVALLCLLQEAEYYVGVPSIYRRFSYDWHIFQLYIPMYLGGQPSTLVKDIPDTHKLPWHANYAMPSLTCQACFTMLPIQESSPSSPKTDQSWKLYNPISMYS